MRRRGWQWLLVWAVVISALSIAACSTTRKGPSRTAENASQKHEGATGAADDPGTAIERQIPAEDFTRRGPNGSQEITAGEPVWMQTGQTRVFHSRGKVARVSIGHPDAAAVVVLDAHSFMINAREVPERKTDDMQDTIPNRMGMPVGRTLTNEPRYFETTMSIWVEGDKHIDTHTLVIADFLDEQVLLEVTVAELNRTALEEHGLDIRAIQKDFIAAAFMGGGAGPGIAAVPPIQGRGVLPLTALGDSPNYAFIFPNEDLTVFFKVLQTEGLATVLAQPKLVAMSGQNAVFQVGGEIPIRIATGFTTDIQFKPFGTLVNFLARVSGEGDIMLTVSPEVSEPDFSQTVEDIPTFRTRRASTSARLRNGETLVIGGLLQHRRQEEERGVPYLKDIPYLGWFFRQTRFSSEETELIVVVKPSLIHPLPPGTEVPLPTDRGPMRRDEMRTQPDEAEVTRPRFLH